MWYDILTFNTIEEQYSKGGIKIDYFEGVPIKLDISRNQIYISEFNYASASKYPLLQVIVNNLKGDKDDLVEKAERMLLSFESSEIKPAKEYSDKDIESFWSSEKWIYNK